jgi:hypothetical protein
MTPAIFSVAKTRRAIRTTIDVVARIRLASGGWPGPRAKPAADPSASTGTVQPG